VLPRRHSLDNISFEVFSRCNWRAVYAWSGGGDVASRVGLPLLGRDCCEQVERKCWDDNKVVFLIKMIAVPDTTN
jgi:hypothetical protein